MRTTEIEREYERAVKEKGKVEKKKGDCDSSHPLGLD